MIPPDHFVQKQQSIWISTYVLPAVIGGVANSVVRMSAGEEFS
jgi:hypothetical protein